MPLPTDLSGRGVSRRGARFRGIGVVVAIVLVIAAARELSQPDRSGQVAFELQAASIGDGVGTSTTIRLHGLSIGDVTEVRALGAHRQMVTVSVDESRVHELSTAMQTRFVSSNVFGATAIEFLPQPGGQEITAGTVVQLDHTENYTITKVIRDASATVLQVITPELGDVIHKVREYSEDLSPLIDAFGVIVRALEETQTIPADRLIDTVNSVTRALPNLLDHIPYAIRNIVDDPTFESDERTQLAGDLVDGIAEGLFGSIGSLLDATPGFGPLLDVVNDLLGPLTYALRKVTPPDVGDLIARVNGALTSDGRRVTLNTEVIVAGLPAIGLPLLFGTTRGGTIK
jgi:phospholipid/cholesterol/gamma-HCH transport system substrate-binding protein